MLLQSRYFYFGGRVYDRGPHWFPPFNSLDRFLLTRGDAVQGVVMFGIVCATGGLLGFAAFWLWKGKGVTVKLKGRKKRERKELDLKSLVGSSAPTKQRDLSGLSAKLKNLGALMADDKVNRRGSVDLKEQLNKVQCAAKDVENDSLISDGFVSHRLPKLVKEVTGIAEILYDESSLPSTEERMECLKKLRLKVNELFTQVALVDEPEMQNDFIQSQQLLYKLYQQVILFDVQYCRSFILSYNKLHPNEHSKLCETVLDSYLSASSVSSKPTTPSLITDLLDDVRRLVLLHKTSVSLGKIQSLVSSRVFSLAVTKAQTMLYTVDVAHNVSLSYDNSTLSSVMYLRRLIERIEENSEKLSKHEGKVWCCIVEASDVINHIVFDGELNVFMNTNGLIKGVSGIGEQMLCQHKGSIVLSDEDMGYVMLLMEASFQHRSKDLERDTVAGLRAIESGSQGRDKIVKAMFTKVTKVTEKVVPDGVCGISFSPKVGDVFASIGTASLCDAIVAYVIGATDSSCRQLTFVRSSLPQHTRNVLLDGLQAITIPVDVSAIIDEDERSEESDVVSELKASMADIKVKLLLSSNEGFWSEPLSLYTKREEGIERGEYSRGVKILFTPQQIGVELIGAQSYS